MDWGLSSISSFCSLPLFSPSPTPQNLEERMVNIFAKNQILNILVFPFMQFLSCYSTKATTDIHKQMSVNVFQQNFT